jgi:hypothetical protein
MMTDLARARQPPIPAALLGGHELVAPEQLDAGAAESWSADMTSQNERPAVALAHNRLFRLATKTELPIIAAQTSRSRNGLGAETMASTETRKLANEVSGHRRYGASLPPPNPSQKSRS